MADPMMPRPIMPTVLGFPASGVRLPGLLAVGLRLLVLRDLAVTVQDYTVRPENYHQQARPKTKAAY